MKISKNSWHHKLMSMFYGRGAVPLNLCTYMLKLIAALIYIPVAVLGLALLVVVMTFPLWQFFTDYTNFYLITTSALLNFFALCFLWSEYRMTYGLHGILHKDIVPSLPVPSIWVEWAKATHKKACPIIEIVD